MTVATVTALPAQCEVCEDSHWVLIGGPLVGRWTRVPCLACQWSIRIGPPAVPMGGER
jgi:hypothetical protein